MHTETTRRAIIAGVAAASFAARPALAAAAEGNDPVIAALAEYERRQAAADDAWKASWDADNSFTAAREAMGAGAYKGEEIYFLEPLEFHDLKSRSMSEAEYEDTITRFRKSWAMGQAEVAALDHEYLAFRAASLEEQLVAYEKARQDRCRLKAAEAAAEKAQIEADNALRAMFETTPTSQTGVIVLLRHAADFLDEIGIEDSLLEDVFTDAIRNAVAVLERETPA